MTGFSIIAASMTALTAGILVFRIVPPHRSLASRVKPYLTPSLAQAGKDNRGVFALLFGPIVVHAADALGRVIERPGREMTLLRLRQAGWFPEVEGHEMVAAYRLAQLRSVAAGIVVAVAAGAFLGLSVVLRVVILALGAVVGATRQRGLVEKAIEKRRQVMSIEIYTVNQLLAMRVRAGGGAVHAVQAIVERGRGAVITELSQALRLQRSGWRASAAFRRIAELTPEPFCSRTYRLLAAAEERGTDLAAALLALSEDVRETRREAIKRSATKRRAAMLVPTIAILAPVLILFVAAPLPYLITGWQ